MQSLFGTDGIRTTIGTSPLTPLGMIQLGKAIGTWITKHQTTSRILIAHDTRHSAPLLKSALKTGLLQYPLALFDAQVLPTPALFYHTTNGPYDIGIMLTASHNTYRDNGIKIFTKQTGKLSPEDEALLTSLFYQQLPEPSYENLGTETVIHDAMASYLEEMYKCFPHNTFLQGIKLVIDAAHGAYAPHICAFLERFGAEVIPLSVSPNGKNINDQCGSLHPHELQQAVLTHQAHAGFAFDGDGDRLIAVTKEGICKDGDELLSFILKDRLYANTPCVVGTIMSNQGLENELAALNIPFYRTPVGDKLVAQKMKETGALLGGEPSGHLILPDWSDTSDGLFTLLQLTYTALSLNDWTFPSFTKLPQALLNVPVATKRDLTQDPYATLIVAQETRLAHGRLVVRYSGTEPLLRVMVEASTYEEAVGIGTLLSQQLAQALEKE